MAVIKKVIFLSPGVFVLQSFLTFAGKKSTPPWSTSNNNIYLSNEHGIQDFLGCQLLSLICSVYGSIFTLVLDFLHYSYITLLLWQWHLCWFHLYLCRGALQGFHSGHGLCKCAWRTQHDELYKFYRFNYFGAFMGTSPLLIATQVRCNQTPITSYTTVSGSVPQYSCWSTWQLSYCLISCTLFLTKLAPKSFSFSSSLTSSSSVKCAQTDQLHANTAVNTVALNISYITCWPSRVSVAYGCIAFGKFESLLHLCCFVFLFTWR